jgi:hypothetical protein
LSTIVLGAVAWKNADVPISWGMMMRRLLCGIGLLLVAGCSKAPDAQEVPEQSAERAGPKVGVTQVSGVSLAYSYGFRIPAQRIAALQEEHAVQCEALTPARCRITGLNYHVRRGRDVYAALNLQLTPDLARRFGKQAIDTAVGRGGMLEDAEITSENSGAVIAATDTNDAAIASERSRIEQQLGKPGLGSTERTQLQGELTRLSNQKRDSAAVREQAAQKLASTPITFNYASGAVDTGLNDGPIWGAIKDGWANIVEGIGVILRILISVLPWVVVAGLLFWLWRRFVRRWFASQE